MWNVVSAATLARSSKRLALGGLVVNHRVFPVSAEAGAAVFVQQEREWALPTGFALVDPNGAVRLVRDGVAWSEREGRDNAHVTCAGGQAVFADGDTLTSIDARSGEVNFVVSGLPVPADGRLEVAGDEFVLGLLGGLARWAPAGIPKVLLLPGKLLLCELDGLVVRADGSLARVFGAQTAQASVGTPVAAHRTGQHVAVVGTEGTELFDAATLESLARCSRPFGEVRGSGLTLGTTAVLSEDLVLIDQTGRVCHQRGLDAEPDGLATLPGLGFLLRERELMESALRFTLVGPGGATLGSFATAWEREVLFDDAGWVAFVGGRDELRLGRVQVQAP